MVMSRTTFTTSRLLEFFSEPELTKQIGHERELWPIATLKELIDNSLDACEASETAPKIDVVFGDDFFSVRDNGPGIPPDTIIGSLDFNVRISDKLHYVAPTRGQQGNALKTVWAAPFVFHGGAASIEVSAHGTRHQIEVELDRIGQQPEICHSTSVAEVKTGTFLRLTWPAVASYLDPEDPSGFYSARQLLEAYSAMNPHAEFSLSRVGNGGCKRFLAGNTGWRKWLTNWPTSSHWYRPEDLQALLAAQIHHDQDGGRERTVRQFLGGFNGLTGSKVQTKVVATAGLSGAALAELVRDGDIDLPKVENLLGAMQAETRPVKAKQLGVIGRDRIIDRLQTLYGCERESIKYQRATAFAEGLPFVLEVGFGVHAETGAGRKVVVGLNWSPTIQPPFVQLDRLLGNERVDHFDPVTVLVHLAYPRLNYRDRGKSTVALPEEIEDALASCIRKVAADHHKEKRRADREDRLNEQQLARLRKANRRRELSIKDAAYRIMEEAYMHASGDGSNPANARQIMYAARPRVLELTSGKCWSKSSYFTQHLLPDFLKHHPELTADWDVVFDARGHLHEPHTGRRIDLGTVAVRDYINDWTKAFSVNIGSLSVDAHIDTHGPANRFGFALFVEKEGFNAILAQARIAERFDLAIMSTKGMSVTACRTVVERLSKANVTILVLRDFDVSGFSIVHTLGTDTRRYSFKCNPKVIDLGLRLDDVENMKLLDEHVGHRSNKNPRERLVRCGATKEEQEFLVSGGGAGHWTGRRVELNAMTSPQFVEFVEQSLREAGVKKVIPSDKALERAYQRAAQAKYVDEHSAKLLTAARKHAKAVKPPRSLPKQVDRYLRANPAACWDDAVAAIAAGKK
jgi:DNA topoisomerase VI subunit B